MDGPFSLEVHKVYDHDTWCVYKVYLVGQGRRTLIKGQPKGGFEWPEEALKFRDTLKIEGLVDSLRDLSGRVYPESTEVITEGRR